MPLALISGASTGIGRASALRLAADGWTVLAGVRDPAAGESLVAEAAGGRLRPIQLDVTDAGQVAAARALVEGGELGSGGLDALVNNAGIAVGGPLEAIGPEDVQRQFEVNVFGQLALTRALLPALRRARGRIVFVSSIGGRVALAYSGLYASSKYALEAIGDSLRVEVRRSGVQVALIEPGSVATPIWDKGRDELASFELAPELQAEYGHVVQKMGGLLAGTAKRGIAPERVADTIAGALAAPRMRARYVIGRDAHVMLALKRLLPARALDRLTGRALGA